MNVVGVDDAAGVDVVDVVVGVDVDDVVANHVDIWMRFSLESMAHF